MAATEKKIADLVAFTTPADGDLLPVVDVSNLSQSDDGSTMKITRANFLGTLFSIAADTGANIAVLPSEVFSILGGTGIASVASATRKITLNIDATVATLTGIQTLTGKSIDGDDNTLSDIAYDSIKTTSRTGSDVKLVTGTAGVNEDLSQWNGDGDLVAKTKISLLGEIYPVGCVYISIISTNPNTVFGFGTWVAFGAGKTLISLDSTDADFDTPEETGGAKTADLEHKHLTAIGADGASLYQRATNPYGSAVVSADRTFTTMTNRDTASGRYDYTDNGGSTAQSIVQPYIVVYMFKRTA